MALPSDTNRTRATGTTESVVGDFAASMGFVRSSHSETVATGAAMIAPRATTLNNVRLRRTDRGVPLEPVEGRVWGCHDCFSAGRNSEDRTTGRSR